MRYAKNIMSNTHDSTKPRQAPRAFLRTMATEDLLYMFCVERPSVKPSLVREAEAAKAILQLEEVDAVFGEHST